MKSRRNLDGGREEGRIDEGWGEGLHRESYLSSVFSLKLYIKFLSEKKIILSVPEFSVWTHSVRILTSNEKKKKTH